MEGWDGLLVGCLETMGDRQALASYFQEGGSDMVGDCERSSSGWEGASMMNFSMRDCRRAKSSAPFPLASLRLWLGCGFGFGFTMGDLRQEDHAGASSGTGRGCAALDALAENLVYEQYRDLTGERTVLFISHRLASTQFCDRILYLENGRVQEEGTHEELLALGGGYSRLFEVQRKYYARQAQEEGEG